MSISKEERERLQDKCNREHSWDRAVKLTPQQVSDMLDALDDADEHIAELQAENERLRETVSRQEIVIETADKIMHADLPRREQS